MKIPKGYVPTRLGRCYTRKALGTAKCAVCRLSIKNGERELVINMGIKSGCESTILWAHFHPDCAIDAGNAVKETAC